MGPKAGGSVSRIYTPCKEEIRARHAGENTHRLRTVETDPSGPELLATPGRTDRGPDGAARSTAAHSRRREPAQQRLRPEVWRPGATRRGGSRRRSRDRSASAVRERVSESDGHEPSPWGLGFERTMRTGTGHPVGSRTVRTARSTVSRPSDLARATHPTGRRGQRSARARATGSGALVCFSSLPAGVKACCGV